MIPVTRTFLPPKTEYEKIIQQIWDSNQIANGGALHRKLSTELKAYLNIDNVVLTTNGTLPIQIALKTLEIEGDVITTPFSYVATTSSIIWENCNPIFVDIDAQHLTIDETKIEAAITSKTTAILATHVFGNPCNVEVIENIAQRHRLKVIYDAAHGFGVNYRGSSLMNYGHVSTCSFHATKLFHTGEGGGIFCKNKTLYNKLFDKHNFGHQGKVSYSTLGINAKMSELQAGMGLAVLPYVNKIIEDRKRIVVMYDELLDFRKLRRLKIRENTDWNYSYYPVIFESEEQLHEVLQVLLENNIHPRRYFYPSLNTLKYVDYTYMEKSENVASCILCLPLYYGLSLENIILISKIINISLRN